MNKVVNLCQLAFKAGKTCYGSSLIPSIQSNDAKLVVYSSACGANRKKKLINKCDFYKICCIELDSLIFNEITNKAILSFAIKDDGFANAINKEMKG